LRATKSAHCAGSIALVAHPLRSTSLSSTRSIGKSFLLPHVNLKLPVISITVLRESDFPEWSALWRQYLASDGGPELPDSQHRNTFSRIQAEDGDIRAIVIREPDDAGKIIGLSHYVMQPSPWSKQPICYMSGMYISPS
jgi:hypothetical protein